MTEKTNVKNLVELTGHPAGLLIWPSIREGFFSVWAGISGIPRIMNNIMISWPATIEKTEPTNHENVIEAILSITSKINVDIPDNYINLSEPVKMYSVVSEFDETLFAIVPEANPTTVSAHDYAEKKQIRYDYVCKKCRDGKIPAIKINGEWNIFEK